MAYLLHQLLSESATRYPDKIAVVFKDQTLTYAQLDSETNRLANQLIKSGVERGDRIGIYLDKSLYSMISVYGILKAGAAYVPIDPMAPVKYINYIISRCGIKLLLTFTGKIKNIEKAFPQGSPLKNVIVMNGDSGQNLNGAHVVSLNEATKSASFDAPNVDCIEGDLAYILFTSGSTGNPKGVMISHRNSLTYVDSTHDFFEINEKDVLSNHPPLHFDMSVFDIFCAAKAGATLVVVPEATSMFSTKIAEFISANKITVWNSVPSALSLLATHSQLEDYGFSNLRVIQFAGEVFPIKYLRRLKEIIPQAKYYNVYGQTEANSSTYYLIEKLPEDDADPIPIGKSFPNFNVFAIDAVGNKITQPGEKGEFYINAGSVAYGYWDDPERTKERFVNNPLKPYLEERVYRTGDLVTLDSDSNYVFVGRKDHMIKSRGYRIEIAQVETAILNHPQIQEAVVIPIPDELIGNRITAVVVPVIQNGIDKSDIVKHCSKQLPRYMIPEAIEFRHYLPKTSSGKMDRRKLTEMMSQIVTRLSNER
jgi:amino acid adenylation domain-containing protein